MAGLHACFECFSNHTPPMTIATGARAQEPRVREYLDHFGKKRRGANILKQRMAVKSFFDCNIPENW